VIICLEFLLSHSHRKEAHGFNHKACGGSVKKFATEVSHIQSNIRHNFATEVLSIQDQFYKKQDQFYKKRKSVGEIAEFYNLDDITTWAIVLEGKEPDNGSFFIVLDTSFIVPPPRPSLGNDALMG